MIPGFRTYVDYVYLKKHFNDCKLIWNPNLNYTRLKESSFEKRRDKKFFQALEREHPNREDRIEQLVSAFLFNNDIWIGDILNEDVCQFHKDRIKRISGLESLFDRDVDKIDFYLADNKIEFETLLLTSATNSPILIQDAQILGVSLETLSIIDHFTGFTGMWFPVHPLLKMRRLQLHKYRYLLHIVDKRYEKLKKIFQKLAHSSA